MFKGALNKIANVFDFNKATLSGCIDIIVVEQSDGTYKCSPFHVRFGKLKVFNTKEKTVTLVVNDEVVPFKMHLGEAGEAYFEEYREEKNIRKLSEQMSSSDDLDFISPSEEDEDMSSGVQEVSQQSLESFEDRELGADKRWKWGQLPEEMDKKNKKFKTSNNSQGSTQFSEGFLSDEKSKKKPELKDMDYLNPQNFDDKDFEFLKHLSPTSQEKAQKGMLSSIMGIFKGKKGKEEEQINEKEPKDIEQGQQAQTTPNKRVLKKSSSLGNDDLDAILEKRYEQREERKCSKDDLELDIKYQQSSSSKKYQQEQSPNQKDKNLPQQGSNLMKEFQKIYSDQQQNNNDSSSKKAQQQQQQDQYAINIQSNSSQKKEFKSNNSIENEDKEKDKEQQNIQQLKQKYYEKQRKHQKIKGQEDDNDSDQPQQFFDEVDEEDEEDEPEIELSLCGNVIQKQKNEENLEEIFESKKIQYEDFIKDPIKIMKDKNLFVKIKDQLYNWELAITIILCKQAFKRDIPQKVLSNIMKKQQSGFWKNLFSFKSQQVEEDETKHQKSIKDKDKEKEKIQVQPPSLKVPTQSQQPQSSNKNNSKQNSPRKGDEQDTDKDMFQNILQNQQQQQISQKISQDDKSQRKGSDDISMNSDSSSQKGGKRRIKKTLRPNSTILKSFQLKPGANSISFQVYTDLQGHQQLDGFIYLWPRNAKIVISDIDGTITRSDVLGQLMPFVGKDWSHKGVVELFANIRKNGYYILYLTARAIGQADQTREFLKQLHQEDSGLPAGPVIMSPDRLLPSFKREVIYKKPEIFKISALRDIKSIFESESCYYCGFGNRDTDAIAYRAVNISMGKIFIINPVGELHQLNRTYKKTYSELNEMVDQVFPYVGEDVQALYDNYTNLNYWKINSEYDVQSLLEEID